MHFVYRQCAVSVLLKFSLKSTLGEEGGCFHYHFQLYQEITAFHLFTAAWLTLSVPKNLYC